MSDWQVLAWQGFEVEVPAEWELSKANRDKKDGHITAHDEEGRPRLAIQWKVPKREVDLEKTLSDYEKRVGKQYKGDVTINDEAGLVSKRKLGKKQLKTYIVESEEETSYGALWYCQECGKAVQAQIIAYPGEHYRPVAERVLASVKDHSNDGWARFATYGIDFHIPAEYDLSEAKLLSAMLSFKFDYKEEKLAIHRWGLASMMLERGDVPSLVWGTLVLKQKEYTAPVDPLELEFHGHPAYMWVGHPSGLLAKGKAKLFTSLRLSKSRVYVVFAWHCPQSNRIFAIEGTLQGDHRGQPRAVAETIICHED